MANGGNEKATVRRSRTTPQVPKPHWSLPVRAVIGLSSQDSVAANDVR